LLAKAIINNSKLIVTNRDILDKGSEIPIVGPIWFTKKPTNMRKAILKFTENKKTTSLSFMLNLRSLRIRKPGRTEM
jgi:hypothetical protein